MSDHSNDSNSNNNSNVDIENQLLSPVSPVSQLSHQSRQNITRQNINRTSNNSTSNSADEWTAELEELVKKWKDQTQKLSNIHQESGYVNRTRYYRLAIPSILIPFVMTLVSQNLYTGTNDTSHIIDGVAFMVTSILSSLLLFFNYNQVSEMHFQTSSRYIDIINRIESELARISKFRTPSDVFITEIKSRIESLNDNAPNLPGTWC